MPRVSDPPTTAGSLPEAYLHVTYLLTRQQRTN